MCQAREYLMLSSEAKHTFRIGIGQNPAVTPIPTAHLFSYPWLAGQAGAADSCPRVLLKMITSQEAGQPIIFETFGSVRNLANWRGTTQTSARCACQHAIGMHYMDVLLVAAFRAFATTSARHQFGSWARRPELDYFAQRTLTQTSSLLLRRCTVLDLRQRSEP